MGISTAPLQEAIVEFDAGEPARREALRHCETIEQVDACVAQDEAALNKVREAFFVVTQDRNSRVNAMMAEIHFMRRIAALGEI